jgi:hypothetical protein
MSNPRVAPPNLASLRRRHASAFSLSLLEAENADAALIDILRRKGKQETLA